MHSSIQRLAAAGLIFASGICIERVGAASLSLDQNFRPPVFTEAIPAARAVLLPDGKFVLFRGGIDTLASQRTGAIVRYLADGTVDTSFAFNRDDIAVQAAAPLADGRLLVAATRRFYGEQALERILRLNANGSIDPTFNIATVGAGGNDVWSINPQPDGTILVAGTFETFAGTARQRIVRLLADGTLDSGFNPPQFSAGSGIYVRPAVLGDGKILIAGNFTTVNGSANLGVARLNSNGSLDSSFQPSGFARNDTAIIRGLVVQSDGRIVLGGIFQTGSGSTLKRAPLIRLHSNGSADTSYAFLSSPNFDSGSRQARDLLLQPDGKVVGAIGPSVYRFNLNGTRDETFGAAWFMDATDGDPNIFGATFSVDRLSDGRILVGGTFTDIDSLDYPPGTRHFGVARLLTNGSIDPTLFVHEKTGSELPASGFARLPDGTTLAAFPSAYHGVHPLTPFNIARLFANGARDTGFRLSSTNPKSILTPGRRFNAENLIPLADGRFFMQGMEADDGVYLGLAGTAVWPNGVEDLGFRYTPWLSNREPTALPDGSILLAAGNEPEAYFEGALTKQKRNGRDDTSFQVDPAIASAVVIRDSTGKLTEMAVGSHVVAVQPDGKCLFVYLSSDKLFHLVRLHTNGSIDGEFTATTLQPYDLAQTFPPLLYDPYDPQDTYPLRPVNGVWTATPPLTQGEVLPDGSIVIAGRFTSFAGAPARGLVRLHANGSRDASFPNGAGAQWTETAETASFFPHVEAVQRQVDGKLLVAGTFEAFNGTPLPGIASLNGDGSLDPSFTPPAQRLKLRAGTANLRRQSDGSFYLSGPYGFPGETERSLIHIHSVGGIPVVGSPKLAVAFTGQPFSYHIVASGQPTSYGASGLPPGFSFNPSTGVITAQPTEAHVGEHVVQLTATNGEGTSAPAELRMTVPSPIRITRLRCLKSHGQPFGTQRPFYTEMPTTGALPVEGRRGGEEPGTFILFVTFNDEVRWASESATGGVDVSAGYFDPSEGDHPPNTIAVGLDDVADGQIVTITLHHARDTFGQTRDFTFRVGFLQGDTNGDGVVNAGDALQTRSGTGRPLDNTNFRTDVNADGIPNSGDVQIVRNASGRSLNP